MSETVAAPAAPEAPAPKLDVKMLILPLVFIFGKKIDWKDPEVVSMIQKGFMSMCAVVLTLYFYVYTKLKSGKGDANKKIWIPPKPKPTLPFGLGPPPEPIEAKDYEETTYADHEFKVLKEGVTAVGMSILISGFMSIKFESHNALLIQGLMMPFNMYDNVAVKKYIFGQNKAADGGLLYGELFKAPTAASLKLAESVKAAKAAAEIAGNEPRVEELPEEEVDKGEKKNEDKKKKGKGKEVETKPATTDAHDID